jgi:hypothetical protein
MDATGGGSWLFIHFREQQPERRTREGSSSTFNAPTIPVGLRSPLAAAPSLSLEGISHI